MTVATVRLGIASSAIRINTSLATCLCVVEPFTEIHECSTGILIDSKITLFFTNTINQLALEVNFTRSIGKPTSITDVVATSTEITTFTCRTATIDVITQSRAFDGAARVFSVIPTVFLGVAACWITKEEVAA